MHGGRCCTWLCEHSGRSSEGSRGRAAAARGCRAPPPSHAPQRPPLTRCQTRRWHCRSAAAPRGTRRARASAPPGASRGLGLHVRGRRGAWSVQVGRRAGRCVLLHGWKAPLNSGNAGCTSNVGCVHVGRMQCHQAHHWGARWAVGRAARCHAPPAAAPAAAVWGPATSGHAAAAAAAAQGRRAPACAAAPARATCTPVVSPRRAVVPGLAWHPGSTAAPKKQCTFATREPRERVRACRLLRTQTQMPTPTPA